MKSSISLWMVALGVWGYVALPGPTSAPSGVNYDRDVLPILSQHCFKCHGADVAKAAAGLRLDSMAGAMHTSGIIIPGSPAKSYAIKRIIAGEMPPSDSGIKPVRPAELEVLRLWIEQGAHYNKHWSYVVPTMPTLPPVSNPAWCKNPIDQFVMAKLDAAGLKPEREADRDSLALRAAETLTGLPPSQVQLDTFRQDTKPGAYERLVDQLMANPAYGEHEARYWLDAVRYGDTHGLQLDNERGVFPYRDWVIRAYNQDLPFDKFVEWQLAGDLLPKPTTDQRVATGYVRMNLTTDEGGAIEEEFLARNTFDRVDTTSTVLIGLTVQCAKCHDHKYDPIKQRDYYGLYAFFNSTKDTPLDGNIALPPPVIRAATPEQDSQLATLSARMAELKKLVDPRVASTYFARSPVPTVTANGWQISPVYQAASFDDAFDHANPPEPGQTVAVPWKPLKFELGKDFSSLVGKDNASVYVHGTITVLKAQTISFGVASDDGVRVWLNGKLIHSNKVSRGVDTAVDSVIGDFKSGDNQLLVKVINGAGADGLSVRFGNPDQKRIQDSLSGFRRAPGKSDALRGTYLDLGPSTALAINYRQLEKHRVELESSIPMSLVAEEMPKPRPTFILKRGQYDQKGDAVSRHIPPFLGSLPVGAKADRLSFAKWLTSPQNPLLARVYVNRVWQQYFGVGIVKTVDDFGSQGEWPFNQPLLDYLAVSFQRGGWSVKQLNRMIVTSAAFRQSSRMTPAKLAKDPENRWIAHGPRFRLDAEVIRDKALFAGGLLVKQLGGRGFKPYQPDGIWEGASDPASGTHFYVKDKGSSIYRRSIYMFWKRTAPPPAMLTFDAPLRDTCIVRRSSTNTPLQALTTENETSYLECSRTMAQRLMVASKDDDRRLRLAYDIAFSRPPKASEVSLMKSALATYRTHYSADTKAAQRLIKVGDAPPGRDSSASEQAAWMLLCSTLMNTDEFLTIR